MTAEEFLKQYHGNNHKDWLYQRREVLEKLLTEYASQQREEGIREGFEAARVFVADDGRHCGDLYPTADDYLNSK